MKLKHALTFDVHSEQLAGAEAGLCVLGDALIQTGGIGLYVGQRESASATNVLFGLGRLLRAVRVDRRNSKH